MNFNNMNLNDMNFDEVLQMANNGDAEAQCAIGLNYLRDENAEEGIAWLLKAAEQGQRLAQYNLGVCYGLGNGVEQDDEKQAYWMLMAAEQGDVDAEHTCAENYERGIGVERDLEKAFQWNLKAAEHGNIPSQFNVGIDYLYEKGVEENLPEAEKWLTMAAEQGYRNAQDELGLEYLAAMHFEKDTEKGLHWLHLAAEHGSGISTYNIGCANELGDGVEKDMEKAIAWFEKAADLGHIRAMKKLAGCFLEGIGVPKDEEKALQWSERAAEAGDEEAQYTLGMSYKNGDGGLPQDYKKARHWLATLAEKGDDEANSELMELYALMAEEETDSKEACLKYRYAFACVQHTLRYDYNLNPKDDPKIFEDETHADAVYNAGDYEQALECYRQAYQKFSAFLAEDYFLPDDFDFESTRKAAEAGDAVAQCELGQYYEKEDDEDEAIKWYTLSSEQGNLYAYFAGGFLRKTRDNLLEKFNDGAIEQYILLARSMYVSEPKIAFSLYRDAFSYMKYFVLDEESDFDLISMIDNAFDADRVYRNVFRDFSDDDEAFETEYYKRLFKFCDWIDIQYAEMMAEKFNPEATQEAAEQGDAEAQCKLGKFYAIYRRDYEESKKWFTLAAEQGNEFAQWATRTDEFLVKACKPFRMDQDVEE